MLPAVGDGTGDVSAAAYTPVSVAEVPRVNSDNTTTTVVQITAQSNLYLVTYSWFITLATFQNDGAPQAAGLKTEEVNTICGHAHVQAFRTEQDQDQSQLVVNYAVITVGTDDQAITTDVRYRMDQIGTPGVFAAIDAAWAKLVALGAS